MSKKYSDLISINSAPTEATEIGVYDNAENKIGKIKLSGTIKKNTGEKLYSFGALSDIHIGESTASEDFQRALTYLSDNADFVCISGDLAHTGTEEQRTEYKNCVDNYSTIPVYACAGNHDGYYVTDVENVISTYTEQPLYYSFAHGDDVFIMVGCATGTSGSLFTQAELQWLYETLEENRNKRCFLFEHVRPDDGCGNALDIYNIDIWGGTEQTVFESLLKHYSNVLFFHGHSHLKLYMQKYSDMANYDNKFGCHSIHIPSLAVPRDTTSIVNPSITGVYADSEGYVVDVYENGVMLRGRDFINEKFLPIATYWLDTSLKEVAEHTYADGTGTINTADENGVENIALSFMKETRISVDNVAGCYISDEEYCESGNKYYCANTNLGQVISTSDTPEVYPVDDTTWNVSSEVVSTSGYASPYATSKIIELEDGYTYTLSVKYTGGKGSCHVVYFNNAECEYGDKEYVGGFIKHVEGASTKITEDICVDLDPPTGATQFRLMCWVQIGETHTFEDFLPNVTLTKSPDVTKTYSGVEEAIKWTTGCLDYGVDGGEIDVSQTAYWASDYIAISDGYSIYRNGLSYDKNFTYTDANNATQTTKVSTSVTMSVLYYDESKNYIGYDYRILQEDITADTTTSGVNWSSIRFVEKTDENGNVIPYGYSYTPTTDKMLKPPGANTAENTQSAANAAYFRIRLSSLDADYIYVRNLVYLQKGE